MPRPIYLRVTWTWQIRKRIGYGMSASSDAFDVSP